jgi:hypothetical protein
MFFNEEGIMNIDEIVVNHASFKNIMEDGVVTEDEIQNQSDKVVAMLHEMEAKYSEEQLTEIKNLLVESSVLYAVYNFYSIQNINK